MHPDAPRPHPNRVPFWPQTAPGPKNANANAPTPPPKPPTMNAATTTNSISGPTLFTTSFAEMASRDHNDLYEPTNPLTPSPAPRHPPLSQNIALMLPATPTPQNTPRHQTDQTMMCRDDDEPNNPFKEGLAQSIHAPRKTVESTFSPSTLVCPIIKNTTLVTTTYCPTTQRGQDHSSAFLAVTRANRALVPSLTTISTSSSKFTQEPPEGFPEIHFLHATQPLDHLSEATLNAWFAIKSEKLVL